MGGKKAVPGKAAATSMDSSSDSESADEEVAGITRTKLSQFQSVLREQRPGSATSVASTGSGCSDRGSRAGTPRSSTPHEVRTASPAIGSQAANEFVRLLLSHSVESLRSEPAAQPARHAGSTYESLQSYHRHFVPLVAEDDADDDNPGVDDHQP